MNSFDHPRGEVRFGAYVPDDVLPALARAEAEALDRLDLVPGDPDPLWAFGEATATFDFIVAIAGEVTGVLDGWHDVARAANERAARVRSVICQRLDLYDVIQEVVPSGPVEERLRADLLRRFEHVGAHLAEADRDRLAVINVRLAELASDFAANLRAADAASGVATDDPTGLPDALVAAARDAAVDRSRSGYYIPYSEQNATVVLREAENRVLREEMYRLTIHSAAETNGPVVTEILALRQELAELLGYPDFVEMHRGGRMVAEPQALLDDLAAAYRPQADREHGELLAFARSYAGDDALELSAADVDNPLDGFYATKLRESLGLASAASVNVPVETAREVMLDALAELYTVTFTRSDAAGWHADVEAFDLRDGAGRHLARIFCDWSLREGKRPFGGWMGCPYLATDGGPHVITVVTNVPPTGADLQQLRIMWHEFGHAMHFAFTRTRYRQRSPDDGPRDFIEGPSRIMENWPLEPEILRRMGVPAETAQAVRAEDRFRTASRRMTRLVRPAIDLAMHRGEDPLPVKQRHLPVPVDPADATAAHFHHVFAGDYGASHYAYQWAGVMDADLFTRFAAEGILNPATGRDYTERVLAHGAERDPAALLRDFLGREVTVRALLYRDGVA